MEQGAVLIIFVHGHSLGLTVANIDCCRAIRSADNSDGSGLAGTDSLLQGFQRGVQQRVYLIEPFAVLLGHRAVFAAQGVIIIAPQGQILLLGGLLLAADNGAQAVHHRGVPVFLPDSGGKPLGFYLRSGCVVFPVCHFHTSVFRVFCLYIIIHSQSPLSQHYSVIKHEFLHSRQKILHFVPLVCH